jgi:SAM-dependent methyltransferase
MSRTKEPSDLLRQDSHFAFGKNWASYADLVSDKQIAEAVAGLRRLAGGDLTGKRFLDIGSGSGLHALAALLLGASEVIAVDIDPDSVTTTRRVLSARAAGKRWQAIESSVFDLDSKTIGQFDVVYSWGVLHHTGDMYRALRNAVSLVRPGGSFIFALYARTLMCGFWKVEKKWYSTASERAQARARSIHIGLFRLAYGLTKRGATFRDYVARYASNRGMDFYHDVHDWMGGWPYESISPAMVDRFMSELRMREVRSFARGGLRLGLFGSGCDEYVYTPAQES